MRGSVGGGREEVDLEAEPCVVRLLPALRCTAEGRQVALPPLAARLLARVCLEHPVAVERARLIGEQRPGSGGDPRSRLRKTAWRINQAAGHPVLTGTRSELALSECVRIDYQFAKDWCLLMIKNDFPKEMVERTPLWLGDALGCRLLEGWDEEWLTPYQREWDVLRLQCLQGLALAALDADRPTAAVLYAERLVREDPFDEGGWHALVSALVASGRRAAATRRFDELVEILDAELGITPDPEIRRLVDACRA
ncbi:BTAD domain-containing putative transcriptional regulator [Planomonospora corallina]|uniref:BTAD domain-containing putative transcriptional regulator n=1 Tax=Planomonospora corallina TaxID=1806052 RepID=A0ABV8I2Y8_9ACTN